MIMNQVNICGKVTVMCFDKTGTLTEEGLDMYGVRSVHYLQPSSVRFAKLEEDVDLLGLNESSAQP